MLRLILLSTLLQANSLEVEESSKKVNIMMFSICLRSHLRTMTSIAQELSMKPNVKVTLVISGQCEEFVKSHNYDFNIEIVHSSVDKRGDKGIPLEEVGIYMAEYENDVLETYYPKWKDPKILPDIVVSEIFAYAGRDLAEIYKLKHKDKPQ